MKIQKSHILVAQKDNAASTTMVLFTDVKLSTGVVGKIVS